MTMGAGDSRGNQVTMTMNCPNGSQTDRADGPAAVSAFVFDVLPNGTRGLRIPLDDGLNIASGSRQKTIESSFGLGQVTLRLSWPTINVSPRYDPDVAR